MWRLSLFLLFALPPAAIALNPHPIASVMIISWTMLVIPLCFMHMIDYLKNPQRKKRRPATELLVRTPIFCLGALSALFGVSIIAWCLYNVCIKLLPEYSGPKNSLELFLEGFGIGPTLVLFGLYLVRLALHKTQSATDVPQFE